MDYDNDPIKIRGWNSPIEDTKLDGTDSLEAYWGNMEAILNESGVMNESEGAFDDHMDHSDIESGYNANHIDDGDDYDDDDADHEEGSENENTEIMWGLNSYGDDQENRDDDDVYNNIDDYDDDNDDDLSTNQRNNFLFDNVKYENEASVYEENDYPSHSHLVIGLNAMISPKKPFENEIYQNNKSNNKKKQKSQKKFSAEMKNKMLLLAMMEERKKEDEELSRKMEQADNRRKKFKEALLERAMKAREIKTSQQIESDGNTKGSVKASSGAKHMAKEIVAIEESGGGNMDMTTAEKNAMMLRKKLKKQQMELLEIMKMKKAEEEKKNVELRELENQKKDRQRKRNEKMLRQRAMKSQICLDHEEEGGQEGGCQAISHAEEVAVGSGLRAVRSRSQGGDGVVSSTDAAISTRNQIRDDIKIAATRGLRENSVVEGNEKESVDNEGVEGEGGDEDADLELRKQEARKRRDKVIENLAMLAQQKKKEIEVKQKKERQAKRRIALLSQRVMMEVTERKLMGMEDKYSNPGGNSDERLIKPSADGSAKVTPEMADAIYARLQARQLKTKESIDAIANSNPPARDFADWKRKHAVPADGQVFCMTGWYPCVKENLLQRGWYHNPDSNSPHYDLKWTLRSSDVGADLQPWQLTNHFLKNIAITTKAGLLKSLRQLVWMDDTHSDNILPRGYDLNNPIETQFFIDDFRIVETECVLKKLYYVVTGVERLKILPGLDEMVQPSDNIATDNAQTENNESTPSCINAEDFNIDIDRVLEVPAPIIDLSKIQVNLAVFNSCCNVLNRYLKPYYHQSYVDDVVESGDIPVVMTALEWELICGYDIMKRHTLPSEAPEPIDEFLHDRDPENKNVNPKLSGAVHRYNRIQKKQDYQARELASQQIKELVPLTLNDLKIVHTLLSQLKIINESQNSLNGNEKTCSNLWIVKPAAKSRGRGIMTFGDLKKLLAYVDMGPGKSCVTSSQWIVQKYMENPLIIANRKFDMRQWVLVADWNPLTIYFYDEFYARFSVEEYTTNSDSLENCFVHLVNNSIGKNSENFHKSFEAENGTTINGYMMGYSDFNDYITWKSGNPNLVKEQIKTKMKNIAKWSLMCAVDAIEHRKNSWELYGFDYMIDDDFNPWLIEINSSPACDYSTKVTERYVQKALVEILNVTLDLRAWEALPKKTRGEKPCVGGWELIYQGPYLETPSSSFGTDMTVKGESIKVPKKKNASLVPGGVGGNLRSHLLEVGDNNNGDDDDDEENHVNNTHIFKAFNAKSNNAYHRRQVYSNKVSVNTVNIGEGNNSTSQSAQADQSALSNDVPAAVPRKEIVSKSNSNVTKSHNTKKTTNRMTSNSEINDSDDSEEERKELNTKEILSQRKDNPKLSAKSKYVTHQDNAAVKPVESSKRGGVGFGTESVPIPIKTFTMDF